MSLIDRKRFFMFNFMAPFTRNTSYGLVAYNLLKTMVDKGLDVAIFPISNAEVHSTDDNELIRRGMSLANCYDVHAPCIRLFHQFSLAEFVGHGPHIGFPIFELDKFNQKELHHLRGCDSLFVCSHWAKNVLIENLQPSNKARKWENDIHVVPLGVDTTLFYPKDVPKNETTIFLNVGKKEYRKGHDVLGEAFNRAFSPDDNVQLWMAWDNLHLKPEENVSWNQWYLSTPMGKAGKINCLPRLNSQAEVAEVMNRATCGVFPSRAEGWNLDALEMLACGKDIIITNYSAHTEFCNKDNSRLIEMPSRELAQDNRWFFGDGNWGLFGESETEQLVDHLRTVYNEHQNGQLKINQAGIDTAKKFSWESSAQHFLSGVDASYYEQ